jgi:divalent metal cation (Fe/Co/Zn/Cd) transporter
MTLTTGTGMTTSTGGGACAAFSARTATITRTPYRIRVGARIGSAALVADGHHAPLPSSRYCVARSVTSTGG